MTMLISKASARPRWRFAIDRHNFATGFQRVESPDGIGPGARRCPAPGIARQLFACRRLGQWL